MFNKTKLGFGYSCILSSLICSKYWLHYNPYSKILTIFKMKGTLPQAQGTRRYAMCTAVSECICGIDIDRSSYKFATHSAGDNA